MSINFRCPSCGTEFLDVENRIAGKKLRCKTCRTVFRAPMHASVTETTAATVGQSHPSTTPRSPLSQTLVTPETLSPKPAVTPETSGSNTDQPVLRSWNPNLRAMNREKAANREKANEHRGNRPAGFTDYKINGRRVHVSDVLCIAAGVLGCLDGLVKLGVLLVQLMKFSGLYSQWPVFAILLVLDFVLVVFYITGAGWLIGSTIKQYGGDREEDRQAHGMVRLAAFVYLGLNAFSIIWAIAFFPRFEEFFFVIFFVRLIASAIPAFLIIAVQLRFKADLDIDKDLDTRAGLSGTQR